MRWEYVKSILLAALVATSFLLTFAIWYYQPQFERLDPKLITEKTKLSGNNAKETINSIIQPKQIIFHDKARHYALKDWNKTRGLYNEIESWPITNFEVKNNPKFDKSSSVEIIFPTSIPIDTLRNTLNIKTEENLEELGVDRIYIQFSQSESKSTVYFVSNTISKSHKAEIRNFNVNNFLAKYLQNEENQIDYTAFVEDRKFPIYVPTGEVTLSMHTHPTTLISDDAGVDPLINILFNDPNAVRLNSSNIGEDYYTDGTRQLKIYNNDSVMQFINPREVNKSESMGKKELIRQSLDFINDHNGWTDDYKLYDISQNIPVFRLTSNGFPVINNQELSVIELDWRNQEIFEYKRPLIDLSPPITTQEVILRSGGSVISYLKNQWDKLPLSLIEDISIGYNMIQTAPSVYTLEPAWFIKIGNKWEKLNFEETYIKQGGDK